MVTFTSNCNFSWLSNTVFLRQMCNRTPVCPSNLTPGSPANVVPNPNKILPPQISLAVFQKTLVWDNKSFSLCAQQIYETRLLLHCAFDKHMRHAYKERTKSSLVVQPHWGFVRGIWNISDFSLKSPPKAFCKENFVANLMTPPSCLTLISPVFFDSNAAKAFLNLKMLSSGMKSAILTPQ